MRPSALATLVILSTLGIVATGGLAAAGEKFQVGPVFPVSSHPKFTNLGGAHGPDMDGGPAGHFVVVWSADVDGSSNQQVRQKSFDESGGPNPESEFSTVGDIASYGGLALEPSVAMDVFGDANLVDFVVTWREAYVDGGGAVVSDIFARRFTWFYLGLGQDFRVNTTRGEDPQNPKVAFGANGDFVIVWGSDAGTMPIRGQRFDAGGNPIGAEFPISTLSTVEGFSPLTMDSDSIEVAANATGEFMVVWKGDGAGGNPDNRQEIFGRHFDSAGNATAGSELVVQTDLSPDSQRNYPDIAADGLGNFVVVWSELGGAGAYGVRARRFDASGSPVGAEISVNGTPGAVLPKVAADAAGNFVVVWEHPGSETHGRQFDASGTPVGAEFVVPDAGTGASPRRPDVAADDDGDFAVSWQENAEIFGVRYGDFPALPCTPAPRPDCREPTLIRRSSLRLTLGSEPKRNRFVWRWTKGEATARIDYGAPEDDTGYSVCLYDGTGLLTRYEIGAGGPCGRKRCWRNTSGANPPIQYMNRLTNEDGIQRVRLKAGDEGDALFLVRGNGENLEIPPLPLTPPVTLQLQGGHGECWTAEFSDYIRRNDSAVLVAVSGSAP